MVEQIKQELDLELSDDQLMTMGLHHLSDALSFLMEVKTNAYGKALANATHALIILGESSILGMTHGEE